MEQKYKVFINNKPLHIIQDSEPVDEKLFSQLIYKNKNSISEAIHQIETNRKISGLKILCENPAEVFLTLVKQFKLIEAAGGIVLNDKNKFLAIKRFGNWDLPKGKIEKNELPKDAALREVEEECGITQLKIVDFFSFTYHTYQIDRKKMLKKTWWYEMKYSGNEKLKPQEEEGLTEAKWMTKDELKNIFFEETYVSIKELLMDFLSTCQ